MGHIVISKNYILVKLFLFTSLANGVIEVEYVRWCWFKWKQKDCTTLQSKRHPSCRVSDSQHAVQI